MQLLHVVPLFSDKHFMVAEARGLARSCPFSVPGVQAGLAFFMRAVKINSKPRLEKQFPVGFGGFATAQPLVLERIVFNSVFTAFRQTEKQGMRVYF
jgi:hypothetical protein